MYTSVDGDGNPAGAGINPLQYKLPELRSGGDSPALRGSRIPSDLPVGAKTKQRNYPLAPTGYTIISCPQSLSSEETLAMHVMKLACNTARFESNHSPGERDSHDTGSTSTVTQLTSVYPWHETMVYPATD